MWIQYSIYNNFSVFCKNFNLKKQIKISPLLWYSVRLEKKKFNGNIQLIYLGWIEIQFGYKGHIK